MLVKVSLLCTCLIKLPSQSYFWKGATHFIGKVRLKVGKCMRLLSEVFLGADKKCNSKVYERFWILTSVTDPDPDPH